MFFKRFKAHLHWRIAVMFSGLMLVLFAAALLVVNQQNLINAEINIDDDLRVTADVFTKLIEFETQSLQDIAKPATSDHAFRQVFSQNDEPTLVSAMRNLVARIENVSGGVMMVLDFDLNITASTLPLPHKRFMWPELIARAESDDRLETSGLVLLDDVLYQVIIAPLLIPDPEAWVVLGFPIDAGFTSSISQISLSDISVYSKTEQAPVRLHASSISAQNQPGLPSVLEQSQASKSNIIKHQLNDERFLTLSRALDKSTTTQFTLGVHGSLDQALQPYRQLEVALIAVFLVGLLFTIIGAYILSRSITQPIQALDTLVAKIGNGDFKARANTRKDEIGSLATTVNQMAGDLEEKQKIRSLLGRVVSNEIAEELLKKDIELGGEEREVSVLFADIRNFTGLSETMSPSDMISLLNRYFERVANVIEAHKGVVDKYIGDEVMAVFGAPIASDDHASLAVKAGLSILEQLDLFNQRIGAELGFKIKIGIGIASGKVVAGNLGSKSRMNYTLVGDTVNIASRLESLTKEYQKPLIVNQATQEQAPQFEWKSLGDVSLRGKSDSVRIYYLEL